VRNAKSAPLVAGRDNCRSLRLHVPALAGLGLLYVLPNKANRLDRLIPTIRTSRRQDFHCATKNFHGAFLTEDVPLAAAIDVPQRAPRTTVRTLLQSPNILVRKHPQPPSADFLTTPSRCLIRGAISCGWLLFLTVPPAPASKGKKARRSSLFILPRCLILNFSLPPNQPVSLPWLNEHSAQAAAMK
jgi:hypothetical protein